MHRILPALCLAACTAAAAHAADPAAAPQPLQLVTSDEMNALIQPRHVKLWQAGTAANWDYAEYERHNLQGALRRWATAIPDYKGQKVADMIRSTVADPLDQLAAAIKAKDVKAFKIAYQALDDGCNACHAGTDHAMVVIKVPDAAAFPDQDFTPRDGR